MILGPSQSAVASVLMIRSRNDERESNVNATTTPVRHKEKYLSTLKLTIPGHVGAYDPGGNHADKDGGFGANKRRGPARLH